MSRRLPFERVRPGVDQFVENIRSVGERLRAVELVAHRHDGDDGGGGAPVAAGDVTVADAGGYYTGGDVEAVLAEVGVSLSDVGASLATVESDLTAVEAALGGLSFWTGTQSAYDAIGSKDPNTLYIVTG